MSINSLTNEELQRTAALPQQDSVTNALNFLVKFIPTEVITLYIAALSAASALKVTVSFLTVEVLYWAFALFTPIFLLLVMVGKQPNNELLKSIGRWPWWKMIASLIAFLIWALAVPNHPYITNEAYAIAASLGALVISTILSAMSPIFERPRYPVLAESTHYEAITPQNLIDLTDDIREEQKEIIHNLQYQFQYGGKKLSRRQMEACATSPKILDRIGLYLFEEFNPKIGYEKRYLGVNQEWERWKAGSFSGSRRTLHYAVRSLRSYLEKLPPEQARSHAHTLEFWLRMQDVFDGPDFCDEQDIKPNLTRIIKLLKAA
jgi:hypothetical protein